MTEFLGIALALACALSTNLGFLYKHRGARSVPNVDARRPLRSAKLLFSSRLFAIGMGVACCSWILHVGALAMIPMSIVQVVLAGGIVLLAIMAERWMGLTVGPRQWFGIGLAATGLVLLGISLPAVHGANARFSVPGMIAFEAGLIAAGSLLILAPWIGVPRHHQGVMLGAASGILFGVSDVAIKALTGMAGAHGAFGLVSPWLLITVAVSIVAFYASSRALQDSDPVSVIAVTSTAANVSGIVGGLVVFGDPFPSSPEGIAFQTVAFTLVLLAAWLMPAPARVARLAVAA